MITPDNTMVPVPHFILEHLLRAARDISQKSDMKNYPVTIGECNGLGLFIAGVLEEYLKEK